MNAIKSRQVSRRAELYDKLYGDKGLSDSLQIAAYRNLDLQIAKLIKDKLVIQSEPDMFSINRDNVSKL